MRRLGPQRIYFCTVHLPGVLGLIKSISRMTDGKVLAVLVASAQCGRGGRGPPEGGHLTALPDRRRSYADDPDHTQGHASARLKFQAAAKSPHSTPGLVWRTPHPAQQESIASMSSGLRHGEFVGSLDCGTTYVISVFLDAPTTTLILVRLQLDPLHHLRPLRQHRRVEADRVPPVLPPARVSCSALSPCR